MNKGTPVYSDAITVGNVADTHQPYSADELDDDLSEDDLFEENRVIDRSTKSSSTANLYFTALEVKKPLKESR